MLICEFDVRPRVDPRFADYTPGWIRKSYAVRVDLDHRYLGSATLGTVLVRSHRKEVE